jgi:hypothetical protein
MIRSPPTKQSADEFLSGLSRLQTFHLYTRLVGLPVRLHSTDGLFTGSGVLSSIEGRKTRIYTATHNMQIATRRKNDPIDDAMATAFKNNVQVWPSTHWIAQWDKLFLGRKKEGVISEVEYDDSAAQSATGNDLCRITVDDPLFAKNVRTILSACSYPEREHKSFLPRLERWQVRDLMLGRQTMYGFQSIQAGFGRISKNPLAGIGTLQHRLVTYQGADLIDTNEGHTNVVLLNASDTDSTWEGDSGGPLFALHVLQKKLYLVGVALGSNYYANRTEDNEDAAITNNAVTWAPL